jgi:protein-disulfide isomerase
MIDDQIKPEPVQNKGTPTWLWWAIGGGCVLLLCIVVVIIAALAVLGPNIGKTFSSITTGLNTPAALDTPAVNAPNPNQSSQAKGNTMGDPNAPVKIIEYADFQCPYCQRYWQQTEKQIIQTYVDTGKVYYEYRSVGAFIGPESAAAAEAAYCAGDQGKFWEYHDALYSHWTGENVGDFTPDKLRQYANEVGLDATTFDTCLTQGTYKAQVIEDAANAKADGVRATPSFLINGQLFEGAQPFAAFQKVIDAALGN